MEIVLENFNYIMDNIEYLNDTNEIDNDIDKEKHTKTELILLYLKVKNIMKSDKAQKIIKNNIIKEKGKHFIKGTRISTDSLGYFFCANKLKNFKELLNEYSSLENEEQVTAAMFCFVKDNMNLLKLLFLR